MFYVVLDIENNPDGSVIEIDTCWRDEYSGELQHHTVPTWEEWLDWYVPKAAIFPSWRVVYAHNGCGWDWLSLLAHLIRQRSAEIKLQAIMADTRMICLIATWQKQCTIRFVDSLHLLKSGLDVLGKKFVGYGKVESDELPHVVYEKDICKFYYYLYNDTELLVEILEKVHKLIYDRVAPIHKLGLTIASTAMSIYRTGYQAEPILIPWDVKLKDFLREGYRGGRVECFKPGIYERVNVYDINSLYPSVMRDAVLPVSASGGRTDKYISDAVGCYKIRFNQTNRSIIPVFLVGGVGVYSGEVTVFSPELDLFYKLACGEVEIIEGYVFTDTANIFRDFVNTLYKLRLEHSGGPLDLICKWLMNNLYGKFGQRPEREKIVLINDHPTLVRMSMEHNLTTISAEYGLYSYSEDSPAAFEHVGIAGMITSHARVKLYEAMSSVNMANVCYCDTDSVHTTAKLRDSYIGKDIGKFKLEFSGRGAYAGKKLYALSKDGEDKIRAKGIRVGGELGTPLTFDILSGMILSGEPVECLFTSASSPKQVLAGRQPCRLDHTLDRKKRTIRRMANV